MVAAVFLIIEDHRQERTAVLLGRPVGSDGRAEHPGAVSYRANDGLGGGGKLGAQGGSETPAEAGPEALDSRFRACPTADNSKGRDCC